jgi:hypothetical protein
MCYSNIFICQIVLQQDGVLWQHSLKFGHGRLIAALPNYFYSLVYLLIHIRFFKSYPNYIKIRLFVIINLAMKS